MDNVEELLKGLENLKDDEDASKVDYTQELPQRSQWTPPPQPGRVTLMLPRPEPILIPGVGHEIFKTKDGEDRLRIRFRDAAALRIVGTDLFYTQNISNQEYNAANDGEDPIFVSALAFLLEAVGELPERSGNRSEFKALIKACQREDKMKIFAVDTELSAQCNENNYVYIDGEQSKTKKGCGREYRQRAFTRKRGAKAGRQVLALPKEGDLYDPKEIDPETKKPFPPPQHPDWFATRFTCECDAEISVFSNITHWHRILA